MSIVYLVATGEVVNGLETYTRHEQRPPLCDAEVLHTGPSGPPAAWMMRWVGHKPSLTTDPTDYLPAERPSLIPLYESPNTSDDLCELLRQEGYAEGRYDEHESLAEPIHASTVYQVKKQADADGLDVVGFAWRLQKAWLA